jgi:hypothetical protein
LVDFGVLEEPHCYFDEVRVSEQPIVAGDIRVPEDDFLEVLIYEDLQHVQAGEALVYHCQLITLGMIFELSCYARDSRKEYYLSGKW